MKYFGDSQTVLSNWQLFELYCRIVILWLLVNSKEFDLNGFYKKWEEFSLILDLSTKVFLSTNGISEVRMNEMAPLASFFSQQKNSQKDSVHSETKN